ncbi:hypothetical protein CRENBAI_003832 [Crenichthys baileyi]|uniref:Uncharacterized protein n=1 Tax=Crenichthys baileyi TaxID=28760 RepID=A0AAV9RNL8_9TELE
MASAFSEAMATSKGNYMDVRTGGAGMERVGDGVYGGRRGNDLRDDDGTDLGEDSDDDGHGSASEISTIAMERQMSADAAVVMANAVKKQSSTTSCGSTGRDRERGGTRVYSLDVPEPRSPDACNQQQPQYPDRASPVGCGEPLERLSLIGSGSCGGGGGCDSGGVGAQHQDSQKSHHYHQQQQIQQQQQQLEVQQDYHCSEHRHSVPALYYQGSHHGSPAQRVSFLKPLTRSRRDAASYSQLSPARQHSSYSGYSSSPEYSSESSLRIWERFRPYRKGPRDEACYVTAGNALRKKVQFAKGEDLHDILDYWKGVSAQQKL